MAHLARTDKLPTDAPQFYFSSSSFVLLRFVRHGGHIAVMTATASEDRLYVPEQTWLERHGSSLFMKEDGTPLHPPQPAPQPIHIRAYSDQDRLMAVAKASLQVLGVPVEHQKDTFQRPYVSVFGAFDGAALHRVANQVAEALGLELDDKPWTVEEELREIYDDLALGVPGLPGHEPGDDYHLGDGVYITADGRVR